MRHRNNHKKTFSWPVGHSLPKLVRLRYLRCAVHMFSFDSERGWRSVSKQIPQFLPPPTPSSFLHSQLITKSLMVVKKILEKQGKISKEWFFKKSHSNYSQSCRNCRTKSEIRIVSLTSTSIDENFLCSPHRVACLLSVLTPLNVLLIWPVVILANFLCDGTNCTLDFVGCVMSVITSLFWFILSWNHGISHQQWVIMEV